MRLQRVPYCLPFRATRRNRHIFMWLITALLGLFGSTAQWVSRMASKSGSLETSDAKYNILAFGDSLTEGYYNYGIHFHPYSNKLEELLNSNGYSAKVHERGNSGERVMGGMERRLPQLLHQFERNGIRLNWVIVLGGTNDLGYGADPNSVYAGLQSLYAACHSHGARVLALTVLQNAGSNGDLIDDRTRLNDLIRGTPAGGQDYVTVLDVERQLPYPRSREDAQALALWDDMLHLTPAGYDALGQIVYDTLKGMLKEK
ncbi:hypothetical protein PLESTB_001401400 [Pleodorina starrii]|uniref:SGNH hydrolase-type esterase domain-containing protein n=1 Tax=Pleodorina starrii TaxID=330485 RepID=A0A9W6BVV0_9CHLO|nr:hypothetical protein PLESTM_000531400 [Pleodorina starrii]GLC58790.1 hypothetical protein PLESTB_001401400 [Pleodorina starrii]GLC68723.1 hypothetical protein PLESTF_000728300 [Pleodorina starrii]